MSLRLGKSRGLSSRTFINLDQLLTSPDNIFIEIATVFNRFRELIAKSHDQRSTSPYNILTRMNRHYSSENQISDRVRELIV